MNRRDLLKGSLLGAAALAITSCSTTQDGNPITRAAGRVGTAVRDTAVDIRNTAREFPIKQKQQDLIDLGCLAPLLSDGTTAADGDWGEGSKAALALFNETNNTNFTLETFSKTAVERAALCPAPQQPSAAVSQPAAPSLELNG